MRNVILILVALLALSASTAKADDVTKQYGGNARSVFEIYDKTFVQRDKHEIEKFVGDIEIGLMWANAVLYNRRQPMLYCQPDSLTLTDTQVIDIIRQAIKAKPKWGDYHVGLIVLVALQQKFPC